MGESLALLLVATLFSPPVLLAQETDKSDDEIMLIPIRRIAFSEFADQKATPDNVPSGFEWDTPKLIFFSTGQAVGNVSQHYVSLERSGQLLRTSGISGNFEFRSDDYLLRVDAQWVRGDFRGLALNPSLNYDPFSISKVRLGFGVQYLLINEKQKLFEQETSNADVRSQRQFVLASGEVGLGKGYKTHFRVGYAGGVGYRRYATDIYVRGRALTNPTTDLLGEALVTLHGPEGRFYFTWGKKNNRIILAGSAKRLWIRPALDDPYRNRPGFLPEEQTIYEGYLYYMSPIKLGFRVGGLHASDPRGMVFLNDCINLSLIFKF